MTFHILVINPGSTSTKVSYFENETCVHTMNLFHDSKELAQYASINDQLDMRLAAILNFCAQHHIDPATLDAIIARGGPCYPLESGTYTISKQMVEDTKHHVGGLYHVSMLGVQLAYAMHEKWNTPIFTCDPTVVDEYQDLARMTGLKGVYRHPASHVLNTKETGRRYAASIGKTYEDLDLIICHIDGGITISAHQKGRMIDGNHGGGGEGPLTPTRVGSLSLIDVTHDMINQMNQLTTTAGGFSSWFGTSNADTIHAMVEQKDPTACRVWNAMIYQIAKWIGSMSCVLAGHVDAILLTGGLMRFADIEQGIRQYCGWIAPIEVFPGEFEQEALARNALAILQGKVKAKTYLGKPIWEGFQE